MTENPDVLTVVEKLRPVTVTTVDDHRPVSALQRLLIAAGESPPEPSRRRRVKQHRNFDRSGRCTRRAVWPTL